MLSVAVAIALVAVAIVGCGRGSDATAGPSGTVASTADVDRLSGLPWVALDALPVDARETARRIERGGPFPYRKDGAVFQNREGILPDRPSGFYHEYTVPTPGAADRGARRIVTGADLSELYYTDDHYRTFRRVRE